MALGSLIIRSRFRFPDRELVEQITENPYLQYFIGLPGYQDPPPFDASTLVLFRKRITADMLNEANEYLLAHKDDDQPGSPSSGNGAEGSGIPKEEGTNKGTLAIDATCALANIRYPQDISLLNETREKLEQMIYRMCKSYGLQLPRRYRRKARKEYLAFAKCRKHNKKQVRTAVRKQLSYVRRDIGYLEGYFSRGYVPDIRDIPHILTILKLYDQQEYMYRSKVHSVPDRIVSISQPWIRPIVRGKAKAPVEFGAKLDVSIDGEGYGRLEKVSFDAYNESGYLIGAVERYRSRTGRYPERVLADQIYRTRDNRAYCKKHGIRLSGSKLGRPSPDAKTDKKLEHKDNMDRIEVERFFSRSKRCYGLRCIVTKLEETQMTSIALSVFVSNLFRIQKRILLRLFWQFFRYGYISKAVA
ncbi:MAG: IS5 family transposase [Candidatus Gastranaerophilales bacterium]|nr:IS5 family transposase [Candidatus Gastranaerophilales bacterium]